MFSEPGLCARHVTGSGDRKAQTLRGSAYQARLRDDLWGLRDKASHLVAKGDHFPRGDR